MIEFQAWPKTPRLFRDITITEKIDGTNAAVLVVPWPQAVQESSDGYNWTVDYFKRYHPNGKHLITTVGEAIPCEFEGSHWVEHGADAFAVFAQSRKRFVTPDDDNHGFARWVKDNAEALVETLGEGRHYGEWWGSGIQRGYGLAKGEKRFSLFNVHRYEPMLELAYATASAPIGLGIVPVLHRGPFREEQIQHALDMLDLRGSMAAPGFDKPEGVVVFHSASGHVYKVTLDNDGQPKSAVQ